MSALRTVKTETADKHQQNTKFLESLKQNPKELLTNWDKLEEFLSLTSSDNDSVVSALFSFYEVHRKEVEFIDWLVKRDIPGIVGNPDSFFHTLLFQLFSVQFFGDRGKRYLSALVEPLVKRVVLREDAVDMSNPNSSTDDSSSMASMGSMDLPMDFVLEECTKFVERLSETRDLCPLGLRETFNSLCKAASDFKVTHAYALATRFFLKKCICNVLVAPSQVMSLEETPGEYATHILKEISKVMSWIAIGKIEEGASCGADITSMVPKLHKEAVAFMQSLADDKVCVMGRKVFLSSVAPPTAEEIAKRENFLRERIADHIFAEENLQAEELYQARYKEWADLLSSPKWKVNLSEKNPKLPAEYFVSSLRTEDSPLLTQRYQGKFRVDFKVLSDYIEKNHPEVTLDPRIEGYQKLQVFSPSHYDYTFRTPAQFPIAAREYLCTRHCRRESETRFLALVYSIHRPDMPITKKNIRAQINLTGTLLSPDPTDPEWTNFDFLFHLDMKGSIPAWLINNATTENMKALRNLAKLFTSLNPKNNFAWTPKTKKKKKEKKSTTS